VCFVFSGTNDNDLFFTGVRANRRCFGWWHAAYTLVLSAGIPLIIGVKLAQHHLWPFSLHSVGQVALCLNCLLNAWGDVALRGLQAFHTSWMSVWTATFVPHVCDILFRGIQLRPCLNYVFADFPAREERAGQGRCLVP